MNKDMEKYLEKAEVLIEALPYIQRFNRRIFVVKYGGSAMVDEELKEQVIKDVTLLKLVGFKPIIVHGGGKEISRWVGKVGMEPEFVNGLRVTDEDTMELAEMVLGRVNKSLVQLVESLGVRAIGISGKDGRLLSVNKKYADGADIGFVGDIKKVNAEVLYDLIEKDFLPVICPVGLDDDYNTYNINADDAACAIAKAMRAEKLAFLTDIEGVYRDPEDPSTWCRDIPEDYTAYLDKGGLKGLRLGINRGYYEDFSQEQIDIAEKAYKAMESCGAELVQDVNLPHLRSDSSVLLYEFKMCLNAYLSTNPHLRCHSLKDMIDYYGAHPQEGLKYGMSILLDAQYNTSGNCTDPKYILDKAKCQREAQEEGLLKILDGSELDVLICPGITDCSPISGYPSITVPAGYSSDNMPFGITFVGRPFSEPTLIAAAYAFEQATRARRAPKL